MTELARSLREYSDLCWQLAAQCKSKRAGRFLRLLAIDLRMAAHRNRRGGTNEPDADPRASGKPPTPNGGRPGPFTPESASTA